MNRDALIESFKDTVALCESSVLKAKTDCAKASSKVYQEQFVSQRHRGGHSAAIIVEEDTTYAAAKKHLRVGETAVLNFANPVMPGGGVQNGAMAQEECLCRSSNLYVCLTASPFSDYYGYNRSLHNHFYSDRLIYTQGVTVFKNDEDIPQLMPEQEWFQVDVITCAAPYLAKRKYIDKAALKALLKGRIKNIFEVAIENGITVLILGAFGCGAFKNPPDVVAAAFHEVIEENRYTEQFAKIVFAIKSTVSGDALEPCLNITAFKKAFPISAEANQLRSVDSQAPFQAIGSLTLPSGRVLKGDEQINPYCEWQKKNKYFGKQFSILGDSISTLEGYNPDGYHLFYTGEICDRTGVHEKKDTWWGKVIAYFGGELLVNNSWSGSRVTKYPNRDTLFPSGCSDERTKALHIGDVKPDVIIIYLGTNDWFYGARVEVEHKEFHDDKIGELADEYLQGDETIFSSAYAKMLADLKRNYPDAEIFCCTLNETCMASNPAFEFSHSHDGIHIDRYNNVIRKTAKKYGCIVIDLYDYHLPYDTIDGSHPTEAGMNTLATLMLHSLCDQEGLSFLECSCAEHEFITAEEYTGGTQYVCRKCGKVVHRNMLNYASFEKLYVGSTVNGDCVASNSDGQQIELKVAADTPIDPDIVDLNPDSTAMLYSADMGIRLFSISKGEDLTIFKSEFHAGRQSECDLHLSSNYIARMQATFIFDGTNWMIRDNNSTNGTWLNDTMLCPGKKYILHPDDMIDFAHTEKFIFFKTYRQNRDNEEARSIMILEAGMKMFHKSDHKDEISFRLIIATLIDVPLFLPVAIDVEAMLGGADPTKLQPGDVLQPSKDVRVKVQTMTANNIEFVPMFTSAEEANKGPAVSTMCMYPQDYLPRIIQTGKSVVINPFGGTAFVYTQAMMKDLVWPLVEQKAQKGNEGEIKQTDDSLIGQTIADRYKLITPLGRGAYFQIYLAKGKKGEDYTVKVCDKNRPGMHETMRTLLLQEPYLMMKFNHPAIPKVIDIIEDEQYLFVVREYIEGETLSDLLSKNGTLTTEKCVALGIELANVLQYLHSFNSPYIYQDMKPANVMVTSSGSVKLIDFGITIQYNPDATEDVVYLGTRGYAAPEQYGGKGRIDPRADIYGLGITLHQCVTGIKPNLPPYETPPICQVNPALSKGLEYIICRCIETNPDNRYQTCAELITDLRNYQNLPPKKGLFADLFGKKK